MIFRKQIIYFFILFVLETPYTLYNIAFAYYIIHFDYKIPKIKDAFVDPMEKIYSGILAVFMSRGIILSLLRFTQPHFLKPYVNTLTCKR